jgi:hypothetical protein
LSFRQTDRQTSSSVTKSRRECPAGEKEPYEPATTVKFDARVCDHGFNPFVALGVLLK